MSDTAERSPQGPGSGLIRSRRSRRHGPLIACTGAALVLLGASLVFSFAGGRSYLRDLLASESAPLRNWLESQESQGTGLDLGQTILRAFWALLFVVWGLFVLVLAALRRLVRARHLPLCLLAYYLGVELLAAPLVAIPLRLTDHYYARDPDHWPRSTDPRFGYNADSLRTPHAPEEFSEERFNLIFLGDSFTFGLGVQPSQTFPALVESFLREKLGPDRARVANFAWPSASPLLSRRRLEAIGDRYHPDFVVHCLDMTDFGDDLRYARMLELDGVYFWHRHLPLATAAFQALFPESYRDWKFRGPDAPPRRRFFATEQELSKSRPHLDALVVNLDDIHAWCEERGAGFAVVILPRAYQYDARECPGNWEARQYEVLGPHCHAPFQYFEEKQPSLGYPVLSLLGAFQETDRFPTCFANDPHWNPVGHAVAAGALIQQLGPLVSRHLDPRH